MKTRSDELFLILSPFMVGDVERGREMPLVVGREYTAAVVAGCRSNYKVMRTSGNNQENIWGLTVAIMDRNGSSPGVCRWVAMGGVDPVAWAGTSPRWEYVAWG